MMLGEGYRPAAAIHVPPWPVSEDPVWGGSSYGVLPVSGVISGDGGGGEGDCPSSQLGEAALLALQRSLSFGEVAYSEDDAGDDPDFSDPPVDAYSCDEFRMYDFKVRRCPRGRSHDWTECPYAHTGEKARRRDPRKFHYCGTACPDFRKGSCKRGDSCDYAHGVFECWLHPSRYRTQPCKDGVNCTRRVCFFAHTPEQLRVLFPTTQQPLSPDSSCNISSIKRRHSLDAYFSKNLISSPTSTLMPPPSSPPSDSPPLSPNGVSLSPVNEVLSSLRHLQLSKAKSMPASWGLQFPGLVSPRCPPVRPGFCSMPATPTRVPTAGCGRQLFEDWCEPTERVESGRDLRAKIYEKLSKEISMGRGIGEGDDGGAHRGGPAAPDVGWVSDLLQ